MRKSAFNTYETKGTDQLHGNLPYIDTILLSKSQFQASGCTARFCVGSGWKPEDRFSGNAAQISNFGRKSVKLIGKQQRYRSARGLKQSKLHLHCLPVHLKSLTGPEDLQVLNADSRTRGYKTFFMLNSAEYEL